MALYVCTTSNYRFVGMAPRWKPEQKGSQPNATTRRSRTRVSAALVVPPAAATVRLAFEDAYEKQAILHYHRATASTRSAWETEVVSRVAASERMLNKMHVMLQMALSSHANCATPPVDTIVGESLEERSASREPAVASLTAPSLSIHANVPEHLKSTMWADDYVEFSSLLKQKISFKQDYTSSIQTPSMDRDPVFHVSATAQPELRTFQQWCRAFEVFMSIYTTRPHKSVDAPKLLKYQQTVRNLAEQGGDWRS